MWCKDLWIYCLSWTSLESLDPASILLSQPKFPIQVPRFLSKGSSLLGACVVRYYFLTASQPKMALSILESVARDRRKQGLCLLDSVNQMCLLKGLYPQKHTMHMHRTPLLLERQSVANCSMSTLSLSSRYFNYEIDSNDFYPCKKMQFVLSLRLNSKSFLLWKTRTNRSRKSSGKLSCVLKCWERTPSPQSVFTQLPSLLHLSQVGFPQRQSSRKPKRLYHSPAIFVTCVTIS